MADDAEIRSTGPSARQVGVGVLVVLLVVFVLSNLDSTTVKFLGFDVDVALALALAIAALVGLVVGYFAGRQAGKGRGRRR